MKRYNVYIMPWDVLNTFGNLGWQTHTDIAHSRLSVTQRTVDTAAWLCCSISKYVILKRLVVYNIQNSFCEIALN